MDNFNIELSKWVEEMVVKEGHSYKEILQAAKKMQKDCLNS